MGGCARRAASTAVCTPSEPACLHHTAVPRPHPLALGLTRSVAALRSAGVIPADPKQPFDVRAVLARLLDGSRFHEFKAQVGGLIVSCLYCATAPSV